MHAQTDGLVNSSQIVCDSGHTYDDELTGGATYFRFRRLQENGAGAGKSEGSAPRGGFKLIPNRKRRQACLRTADGVRPVHRLNALLKELRSL
jgi:hypothetical protein